MNTSTEDYIELDLIRFLKAIWKRAWVVAISAVLCAVLAFGGSKFMIAPSYQAGVLLYVNNSSFSLGNTNFSFSPSELSAAKTLVDTYIVILNTRSTLETVITKAELSYSYEDFVKMIDAEAVDGTEVFAVTVTSKSPAEAANVANVIAEVLPDKVAAIVEGSSVRVVDYAVVPQQKSGPNISKYTIVGFIAGALLACAVIVIFEMMDDQIHDENYLSQTFDIPVLANIPNLMNQREGSHNSYYGNKK